MVILVQTPSQETGRLRSQCHGSSSEKWLIINSAGKGCPPPQGSVGRPLLTPWRAGSFSTLGSCGFLPPFQSVSPS